MAVADRSQAEGSEMATASSNAGDNNKSGSRVTRSATSSLRRDSLTSKVDDKKSGISDTATPTSSSGSSKRRQKNRSTKSFLEEIQDGPLFWGSVAGLGLCLLLGQFAPPPVIVQMVLNTFFLIYIGCHLSLLQKEVDPDTGVRESRADTIQKSDAVLFPVIGSAALLSLYIVYRFLSPYWVNLLLALYLGLLGCVAFVETGTILVNPFVPSFLAKQVIATKLNLQVPFMSHLSTEVVIDASILDVCLWVSGLALHGFWMFYKNWIAHNIFAFCFSIQAIGLMSVSNFTIATILLSGLFFYDIFWVFGTDVMVTVAKAFEGPAKIIMPLVAGGAQASILGLGDIVLPGIFISMVLRYDHHLHITRAAKKDDVNDSAIVVVDIHQKFSKYFFWCVILGYELGLVTTGLVMLYFRHAQPALLYLVPFVLAFFFGSVTLKGQLTEALAYSEEDPAAPQDEGEGTTRAGQESSGGVAPEGLWGQIKSWLF